MHNQNNYRFYEHVGVLLLKIFSYTNYTLTAFDKAPTPKQLLCFPKL